MKRSLAATLHHHQTGNRLQRCRIDRTAIETELETARRHGARATNNLDDCEAALVWGYQAVVVSANALVHSMGYHANRGQGHRVVFDIVSHVLDQQSRGAGEEFLTMVDELRGVRHTVFYGRAIDLGCNDQERRENAIWIVRGCQRAQAMLVDAIEQRAVA